MNWVRKNYNVPAKVGGRVEYTGSGKSQMGTITGSSGPHLMVRLDGARRSRPYHPTWEIRYC